MVYEGSIREAKKAGAEARIFGSEALGIAEARRAEAKRVLIEVRVL